MNFRATIPVNKALTLLPCFSCARSGHHKGRSGPHRHPKVGDLDGQVWLEAEYRDTHRIYISVHE